MNIKNVAFLIFATISVAKSMENTEDTWQSYHLNKNYEDRSVVQEIKKFGSSNFSFIQKIQNCVQLSKYVTGNTLLESYEMGMIFEWGMTPFEVTPVQEFIEINRYAGIKRRFIPLHEKLNARLPCWNIDNLPEYSAAKIEKKILDAVEIRVKSKDDSPFLKDSPDLFQEYLKLAREIGETHLTGSENHTIWARFGALFMYVAHEGIRSCKEHNQQDQELLILQDELKARIKEKKTNYEWFVPWIQRLSILMTAPQERILSSSFNTYFDHYLYDLFRVTSMGKPAWYSHEEFEKACNTTWSPFAQNYLSPTGMAKLYPFVIFFPYPFDLSIEQIVEHLPDSEKGNLWLVGWPFKKYKADNGKLSSMYFMKHDFHHFATLYFALSGVFPVFEKGETSENLWKKVLKNRKVYLFIISEYKNRMKKNSLDKKDGELIFNFFHEEITGMNYRLSRLWKALPIEVKASIMDSIGLDNPEKMWENQANLEYWFFYPKYKNFSDIGFFTPRSFILFEGNPLYTGETPPPFKRI